MARPRGRDAELRRAADEAPRAGNADERTGEEAAKVEGVYNLYVNRTIESVLRFVNLTSAGLLAGSLGFGDAALVPGWKEELPRDDSRPADPIKTAPYMDAIGPLALGTAV